ncbi:MAG: prolyl oligopeptidase family serine peptidase [Chitinivibrionales bacterium]|nr:prolyl oligopeptidase family serine peptidase [Chitinivibrionales bacterium]
MERTMRDLRAHSPARGSPVERSMSVLRAVRLCLLYMAVIWCSAIWAADESTPVLLTKDRYKTFYKITESPLMALTKREAWRTAAPAVRTVEIESSADGSMQPALFYDSETPHHKPLLLVLHSWSADYLQHFSIPYGVWAVENDWVFIHPDYRGPYTNPNATASELAVRDVLDAVEYARAHARVDDSRIYITGFSGGGMMTLVMVGRYPRIWAGAAAWVPVYDLVDWYRQTKGAPHDYSDYIERSCGGPPLPGTPAEDECRKRSPVKYLRRARRKRVQVYIATGIRDNFVPPSHTLHAFNDLARRRDRIGDNAIEYISENHALPDGLGGEHTDSLYADAGVALLFERTSRNAVIKLFEGRHDVIYNAGLVWLSRQRR